MTLSPETPAPLGTDTGPDLRETQRIYVACLAAYNNGHLHGAWIEATSPDEV
ncbi:MAG: antirestriction protein ArdA, partial [Hyphomonas oceanitis]